ncbi:MAG: sugar phosphate isomerase/epimerase, partial [Vallitaleaceae bacterium]|nr:sugar phosphate isomerase/epimerase [Vallitaleaceae bacterium]
IGRSGTMLTIENTGDFHLEFIREATKSMIQIRQIQLTYDIGHDYSSFGNDKEFIIEHLDRIKHMHIHDAIGVDHHLALGSGEMPLHKYIGFASNYHLRCVIEAKTMEALSKSVEELPNYKFGI